MASRTAGLSPRRPATRDHGIGLSLKRPHPIQPVHIGMTKTQPGFQHIETVAIVEPFLQRRERIGRLDERGHPRRPLLFRMHQNQTPAIPLM